MLGLGSYPSYTWRSLWITRGLLEKGLGWRVGTGTSISIWNDCWLPGPGGCKKGSPTGLHIVRNVYNMLLRPSHTDHSHGAHNDNSLTSSVYANIYHEGLPQSVSNVVTFIRLYLRGLSFPGEGSRLCVGVPEVRWQPLVGPFVKVIFDASFLSHSRQSYSGIIVRNVESLVLEASIQMHSNVPNAFVAEALAFFRVVCFDDRSRVHACYC
ncbi:hypothetical protein Golax_025872 [Gossypium laxum]|uniref:Reverse transcriptase n=1 Tax=Gossypium laxum TaxID=34288 RepID=A0A7J9B2G7_9ROSI|nr:hypothetical protein [Gossypium laxum]